MMDVFDDDEEVVAQQSQKQLGADRDLWDEPHTLPPTSQKAWKPSTLPAVDADTADDWGDDGDEGVVLSRGAGSQGVPARTTVTATTSTQGAPNLTAAMEGWDDDDADEWQAISGGTTSSQLPSSTAAVTTGTSSRWDQEREMEDDLAGVPDVGDGEDDHDGWGDMDVDTTTLAQAGSTAFHAPVSKTSGPKLFTLASLGLPRQVNDMRLNPKSGKWEGPPGDAVVFDDDNDEPVVNAANGRTAAVAAPAVKPGGSSRALGGAAAKSGGLSVRPTSAKPAKDSQKTPRGTGRTSTGAGAAAAPASAGKTTTKITLKPSKLDASIAVHVGTDGITKRGPVRTEGSDVGVAVGGAAAGSAAGAAAAAAPHAAHTSSRAHSEPPVPVRCACSVESVGVTVWVQQAAGEVAFALSEADRRLIRRSGREHQAFMKPWAERGVAKVTVGADLRDLAIERVLRDARRLRELEEEVRELRRSIGLS